MIRKQIAQGLREAIATSTSAADCQAAVCDALVIQGRRRAQFAALQAFMAGPDYAGIVQQAQARHGLGGWLDQQVTAQRASAASRDPYGLR